jgi:hypothetical protein
VTWRDRFSRARAVDADLAAVREALADRRASRAGDADVEATDADAVDGPREPSPARVVADADVLAADLLVGGVAREALDHLRRHSWTALVASDALVDDAAAVVRALAGDADPDLAADWRATLAEWREAVGHPAGDQPALGSAYRGGAMHLLSFDDRLTGVRTGAALQGRSVPLSVRPPDAFARLFDPASLYPEVVGGDYPGPDRDPRA